VRGPPPGAGAAAGGVCADAAAASRRDAQRSENGRRFIGSSLRFEWGGVGQPVYAAAGRMDNCREIAIAT